MLLPYWATQLLSSHGLKSPLDVILFLKSPAGLTLTKLIHEELEQLAEMQAMKRQRYQDNQTRRQRS